MNDYTKVGLINKKWGKFVSLMFLFFILVGCMQQEDQPKAETNNHERSTLYPRTIDVEGSDITLEEKPKRIATLSLNVAEVALDLVDTDSIIAVTTSMGNDSLSHYSEQIDQIEHTVTGATSLDPEVVISYDPDLVLLTLTHGAEQDADEMLQSADIPIASFTRWMTLEDLMHNYELIGELLGEEEKASDITTQMDQKIRTVEDRVKDIEDKPSVLLLSQVGSNTGPYILGPSSIAYDIIDIAGGIPASDLLDLDKTTPASMEYIIEMDPDYIILVEWGATSDEFSELIESPGFNTLQAVEDGHVMQIEAKYISQANQYIVDTLEDIVDWIHEDELN